MTIAEIRRRSETELKLATAYLLEAIEEKEDAGAPLRELLDMLQGLREPLRAHGVGLRFGYRNQIEAFVRSLFMQDLLSLDCDPEADKVVCHITKAGREELRAHPPATVLEGLKT